MKERLSTHGSLSQAQEIPRETREEIALHILKPNNTQKIWEQYIQLGQELEKILQKNRMRALESHGDRAPEEIKLHKRHTSIVYRRLFQWTPLAENDTQSQFDYDDDVTCVTFLVNTYSHGELDSVETLIRKTSTLFEDITNTVPENTSITAPKTESGIYAVSDISKETHRNVKHGGSIKGDKSKKGKMTPKKQRESLPPSTREAG